MNRLVFLVLLPLLSAAPAAAQTMAHDMPGMTMPPAKPSPTGKAKTKAKPKSKPKTAAKPKAVRPAAPKSPAADPHAGHDMSSMPGTAMPPPPSALAGAGMPVAQPESDSSEMPGMAMPGADAHAGHEMAPAAAATEPVIPQTPPPPAPTDRAADRYYDPAEMNAAVRQLRREHGGATYGKVMLNLAEYQARSEGDGYRWDGRAWFGGDINRLVVKSEGEGSTEHGVDAAEVQALYSRAIGRYFDLQAGVRQDFEPASRTYATVGVEGLFPYWFDVEAALFLSSEGELLGRVEGSYDLRLTQRVILQPRVELNLAAQNTPETRTGSGLSNAEIGLRLRYEVRREFAPYVGVSYDRRLGRTADYARFAGDSAEDTSVVFGIRTWF